MSRHSFPKSEHLCGKTRFQLLFREGQALYSSSLKLLYRVQPATVSRTLVGVVVPKRLLRHAVDRNRMKRRMREAYRLGKPQFSPLPVPEPVQSELLFIYTDKSVRTYAEVKRSMDSLLSQWRHRQLSATDKKNTEG